VKLPAVARQLGLVGGSSVVFLQSCTNWQLELQRQPFSGLLAAGRAVPSHWSVPLMPSLLHDEQAGSTVTFVSSVHAAPPFTGPLLVDQV
jgi:hypothetical protein